jgi:RimJ/RimL family protein N-acetyltransferase
VADALDRDGAFLDVGCANGLLMESVVRWGQARGRVIEPYGLEIAPELAEVARTRLPAWADRIFVGNALCWRPRCRFDYVRASLEYVPPKRRRALVVWLLENVVAPRGRLIIGKFNEEVEHRLVEKQLLAWGVPGTGRAERPHRGEPRLAYRTVWLDLAPTRVDQLSFRPLRLEDLPLMQRWLSMPHVDAWWHEPLDAAGVQAKYAPRIDGSEPTHVFLIEHGAQPIGWIQWYRWADYPKHAALLGADPDMAGIDLALGEARMLGLGLGPQAIRAFLEKVVFQDTTIVACVSDPETRNTRSVRAFEKAGFNVVRTAQLPGERTTREVVRYQRARLTDLEQ